MKNQATSVLQGAITDGIGVTDMPGFRYERHYVHVEFFSDAEYQNMVDKSTMTGVCKVELSENGIEYGTLTNGSISLGSATYNRPHAAGSYETVRFDPNTISGATHYRVTVHSHE